jgi:hypothetical protein
MKISLLRGLLFFPPHNIHIQSPTRPTGHAVVRPEMMTVSWLYANTGAIGAPEPRPLRLLHRHVEPFVAPIPLPAVFAHVPALLDYGPGDGAIGVAPVFSGERNDLLSQLRLTQIGLRRVPKIGPDLPNGPTRPMPGDVQYSEQLPTASCRRAVLNRCLRPLPSKRTDPPPRRR